MSKERFAELLSDERSEPNPNTPGMSATQVLGKVWDEMAHFGAQGAQEVAAAIFTGNAFVLYPHAGKEGGEQENLGHGLHGPAMEQPEIERGGRE